MHNESRTPVLVRSVHMKLYESYASIFSTHTNAHMSQINLLVNIEYMKTVQSKTQIYDMRISIFTKAVSEN